MDDSGLLGGGILSGPASSSRFLDPNPSIQRAGSLSHHYHHQHHHHHHHHMDGMEPMDIVVTKGALKNCSSRGKGISAIGNNSNASSDDVGVGVDVDDERSVMEDENDVHVNGVKGKKGSMWQRMKWTDKVVRLLITAVSYVGDDGVVDSGVGAAVAVAAAGPKRKSGSVQKRGKWKMVSRIMMEMGCHVSPQQCEDKFNDMNKRYKRLNEILGRGISCQVVENPILLDSMNHISLKMKNTVRKILSSKHLFYREMCAYHNGLLRAYSKPLPQCFKEGNGIGEDDDDDDDNENEDCGDHWENEGDTNGDKYVERIADLGKKKINAENCSFWSQSGGLHDGLGAGMAAVVRETATKSPLEHQDIRNRLLQLHGQRVSVQAQVFELERRRLEWQRFCGNKDRELERLRLENERFRIENERMALQLKKKEMEIYFMRSEASFNPVTTAMDRIQGRNQIDLGRVQ